MLPILSAHLYFMFVCNHYSVCSCLRDSEGQRLHLNVIGPRESFHGPDTIKTYFTLEPMIASISLQ